MEMDDWLGLRGCNCVVTGAASGIGAEVASSLARVGARVALLDRDAQGAQRLAACLNDAGATALAVGCDVSDPDSVAEAAARVQSAWGTCQVLVNNAGLLRPGGLADVGLDDWNQVLAINLTGYLLCARAFGAPMRAAGLGSIVHVASISGLFPQSGSGAYSASKAGLINFTQTAACDLGGFNVRVNAVCPGLIETGMTKPVFDYARQTDKIHKVGSRCELRRYGLPKEIACAILFLASDEASYITGQALAVDGGNTASLNLPGMKA